MKFQTVVLSGLAVDGNVTIKRLLINLTLKPGVSLTAALTVWPNYHVVDYSLT